MNPQSPWSKPKPERDGDLGYAAPCPKCGKGLDGYTCIDDPGTTPSAGMLSICIYCGAELQYWGEPLMLRRLRGEELILARARPTFRLAKRVVMELIAQRNAKGSPD